MNSLSVLLQGRSQEFATGTKGGPSPSGVQGQSPSGGLGLRPGPETNANFQLRRGDMHPCPPSPWLDHCVIVCHCVDSIQLVITHKPRDNKAPDTLLTPSLPMPDAHSRHNLTFYALSIAIDVCLSVCLSVRLWVCSSVA